jgi:hypothetical protein
MTCYCIYIGSAYFYDRNEVNTFCFYLSNIVFDNLTILATVFIFRKVLYLQSLYSIPTAVLADMCIAALFSICSLYFGLYLAGVSTYIPDILLHFIGLTSSGKLDLGKYFWVMHSTFIPTLIYLLMILFTWIGKFITIPVLKFFKRGKTHEKPYDLTAYTFTFFAVLLGGLAKLLESYLKKV